MSLLSLREEEIFRTIRKLAHCNFVLIGGYAVNAYTLPRFSVDCDIVVRKEEQKKIEVVLKTLGYKRTDIISSDITYAHSFERYEKSLQNDLKVSVDVLIDEVFDRQTNVSFSTDWIFENSSVKSLKGKTIIDDIKIRIINVDALVILKFISARITDIRDIFMLITQVNDLQHLKEEITARVKFNPHFTKIKTVITSETFKNNLQGVFGYVDEKLFEKHKNVLLSFSNL